MFARELFESILRLPGEFAGVAAHDPLSAVLMVIGSLIVLGTVGFVGYLVLGALAELLNPTSGGEPRQPGR